MKKTRVTAAAVIYFAILVMNLAGLPRVACDMGNHVFVLACLIFCAADWKDTHDSLLLTFMIFTFAADVTSGFPATFAVGVVLFFASQIVMSMIIWKNNGNRHGWILRAVLTCAGLAAVAGLGLLNPLYAFGIVYFMWFVANVVQAVAAGGWKNVPLRTAMVFYLIGDICLISNLLVPEGGIVKTVLTYGTWIPYLPAVFVIAQASDNAQ